MKIAVFANNQQWEELTTEATSINLVKLNSITEFLPNVDAYIILENASEFNCMGVLKPVFINSVIDTLQSLHTSKNVVRINGWAGFLQRNNWEIAGEITQEIRNVILALNKQYTSVQDEPGMIAGRVIAMIINEAYFALSEAISTKNEIDIAMKLGTNYPLGPFEWAEQIGLKNILLLLNLLSTTDKRYIPAALLEKETFA